MISPMAVGDYTERTVMRSCATIRCPHCGAEETVSSEHEIYDEGEHEVWCDECDHVYRVSTIVDRTYESPPLLPVYGPPGPPGSPGKES